MSTFLTKLSSARREYTLHRLNRADLTDNPINLFNCWLQQAFLAKIPDPNAMNVSTVDKNGQPYQRIILLKHFNYQSMVFYTNLGSRKAIHLESNPRISLHFSWLLLEKQILVLGTVKRLLRDEEQKYFDGRPRDSQIGTWVSQQSSQISSRHSLENKFLELKRQFSHKKIPIPPFWGGYRVFIDAMEFWQGGAHRLHDRFLYQKSKEGWSISRLSP